MKMIELFADKCPKSTLLNGPFGGDDKAFDRLLGPSGVLTRTRLVTFAQLERATVFSRTEAGKVYQIANQDKITPESYGQVVTLIGKTNGDTITVETLKM